MDFALTDEQSTIYDMAFAFGQEEIAPNAQAWEAAGEIPKDLWPKLAELGFGGLYVSEENGGAGLTRLDATLVFEALSAACPSVAAMLSIHNMCAAMIDKFGSEDLRAKYLGDAITMERLFAYCLTEPGSGSDAAALKARAEETESGFSLTGTKAFISGGGYADAYIVMARTDGDGPKGISAMVVEDGTEGLSFGGLEQKMGWKSQPTRQVQLDNCHISATNLLGERGKGFTYAMAGLDGGRLNISACSLGAAQNALNLTLQYMGERKAFGKSIDQFQALQFRLADMEIEMQAARTFLRQAAWKLDTGAHDATKFCAMAKRFVTETGSKTANQCLQLHGGYGYLADYGIEKIVRDLRVHEILEGTNEIMRMITARTLLAERNQ
ncbi:MULTISPECIES: acyl-CoA dehydrogenase family protein [Halocynthiibacter]|uniref:Acyl-CoA dehydrogenase family protein n=1 Tax=Halocynthiibacter halioticoli TaxID=2986804 RepID=A0AAE3LR19_9RHOB|nr:MULTISPECIES: acyl-CoA dehydrogenase family protein [Halocynthiibacter]MCV6824143.1 acyl-CoA dehydrogenase family protein [Halocynthiibacter halioticoli]MCW4057144.1 acyl-CoA dehydrogenase family protein [Halocynthiibacter sp. SDUM655004]